MLHAEHVYAGYCTDFSDRKLVLLFIDWYGVKQKGICMYMQRRIFRRHSWTLGIHARTRLEQPLMLVRILTSNM